MDTMYVVTYRFYNTIEVVHFYTFSQYVNWEFALMELNTKEYTAFEVMSIREVR